MNYKAAKAFILNKLDQDLSDKLFYHGKHHTLDVLAIVIELCKKENISKNDTLLLKTAALFHDSGFTISIKSHEELGCTIARKYLPQYDYSEENIEKICGMIMATKIPQTPKTHLEEIICDADLDYLGRDDFYQIGETLFQELKIYGFLEDIETWNKIQVKFIGAHHFWTKTNIQHREVKKQEYLNQLKIIVERYNT